MSTCDVMVVGAGVVGLAIAAELSKRWKVLVVEKNRTYGQETSSRNSEVIHAGIYYPEGSLKARLCVSGNELLYAACRAASIGHERIGKLIVATNGEEQVQVERLYAMGTANGAELRMLSGDEVRALEPNVVAECAILSPNTGIVDSHGLMRHLYGTAVERGCQFVFDSQPVSLALDGLAWKVGVSQRELETVVIEVSAVVNAAGLGSDAVAALAGIDIDEAGYRLRLCKGEYFSVARRYTTRLVYPVPEISGAGLGVHFTVDLAGRSRLGPNTTYVSRVDYTVDESKLDQFWRSAQHLVTSIAREDLAPEFAGVRPRLQGPGEGFRDFVIREETDRGLPGLVNLVGIESPGLTASLAIGRMVSEIVAAAV